MLRRGKSQKQAVIRTLANKEALNFGFSFFLTSFLTIFPFSYQASFERP